MKVIALIGSPRKGGNSDIPADKVLRGALQASAEVEKVYLDDLNIRPIAEAGVFKVKEWTHEVMTTSSNSWNDSSIPKLSLSLLLYIGKAYLRR